MIRKYSTYIDSQTSKVWKMAKRECGYTDDWESLVQCANVLYQHHFKPQENQHWEEFCKSSCFSARWSMFGAWRYHNCNHYFLDNGVTDFCINAMTNQESVLESLRNIPVYDLTKPKDDKETFPVCFIHTPTSEGHDSIALFTPRPYEPESTMSFFCRFWNGVVGIPDDNELILKAHHNGSVLENPSIKFIAGFSSYIAAFPQTIQATSGNGVIKHFPRYKGRKTIVNASKMIRDEESNAISPHFRRGHFRYLQSDRYTNAKGTVVFVKGCFVKGKAYDVHSLDTADEMQSTLQES